MSLPKNSKNVYKEMLGYSVNSFDTLNSKTKGPIKVTKQGLTVKEVMEYMSKLDPDSVLVIKNSGLYRELLSIIKDEREGKRVDGENSTTVPVIVLGT